MDNELAQKEKHAYESLTGGQLARAHGLFKELAQKHRSAGNLRQAAVSAASAASCWEKEYGEKTFFESAKLYQQAAMDATACKDYAYASLLFKRAAINFERDGEFISFSETLYCSKEMFRKSLIDSLDKRNLQKNIEKLVLWFSLSLNKFCWGYGERPFRTLTIGIVIILLCTVLFMVGGVSKSDEIIHPGIGESLYFSIVTFTTLGYGDINPVGASKFFAVIEVLAGIIIMPLFVVGLSRKYLRI